MCDEDMTICNSPSETDAETCGVAGKGEFLLVVDKVVERVVGKGRLNRCDGVGDIVGCYQSDFNRHFLSWWTKWESEERGDRIGNAGFDTAIGSNHASCDPTLWTAYTKYFLGKTYLCRL